jgi:hypothetical protein
MDRFDCTFSHGIARLQWSMFILYSSLVIICMYALPIVWIGFMVFDATIKVTKCTIKPVHMVTSIKQSPVLKGHLFLVLS